MDIVADLLTRIRNAVARKHKSAELPHSKLKEQIALVLLQHGYLKKVDTAETVEGRKVLKIFFKYQDGQPVILDIKRVSKPGQRIYGGIADFRKLGGRRGMVVISTSQGVMSHWEAKKQKVGGEILCVVY